MSEPPAAGRHGPRLSRREYERGIIALHEQPGLSGAQIRRAELELAIDHRLGTAFPADRREALWRIQQRLPDGPLGLIASWVTGWLSRPWLERRTARTARHLVASWATVLDAQELRDFLGERDSEDPGKDDGAVPGRVR